MINIDELIKSALKEKRNLDLKVYRNIKSKILEYKTAKNAKPYDEAAEIQILKKMDKQLQDSENLYKMAKRGDLEQECILERKVISNLLPKPADTKDLILAFMSSPYIHIDEISENYYMEKSDMGNAIKYLKNEFPYNDGKEISEIVKQFIK